MDLLDKLSQSSEKNDKNHVYSKRFAYIYPNHENDIEKKHSASAYRKALHSQVLGAWSNQADTTQMRKNSQ